MCKEIGFNSREFREVLEARGCETVYSQALNADKIDTDSVPTLIVGG